MNAMSNEADIVERLRHVAGHLINGDVEDGAIETAMLCDAADLITKLRAERDAAARDMRERCAKEADKCSRTGDQTSGDDELYGDGWADCGAYVAGAIRALPDTPGDQQP